MKRTLWLMLATLSFVFSLPGYAAPLLVDPEPIAVPAKLVEMQVTSDIKRALISRGWVVGEESSGQINATLNLRKHVARIAIYHDLKQVRVVYISSENLNYKEKDGKRTIHKNYLSWINNLTGDISKNMQLSALN
jgi:hypothetical protein